MHAQAREALIMSQAQLRHDERLREDHEQVQVLVDTLHGEALQNHMRSQELLQAERHRIAELAEVRAALLKQEASHEAQQQRATLALNEMQLA